MLQPYNLAIGADQLIRQLAPADRERLLERLGSTMYQQELNMFVSYLSSGFVSVMAADIGADEFEKIRIQTAAITTFLGRLAEHGHAFSQGAHKTKFANIYPTEPQPEVAVEVESVDNAPKDETAKKAKANAPSTATL